MYEMLANTQTLMALDLDVDAIVNAVIYSGLGLVLFGVFWMIMVKVTPFSIQKEIEVDQNTSLGIILAAFIIGIAMIISAAIQG
jgi:uncharacterized membrane protein YjfL (UPF0719 family)